MLLGQYGAIHHAEIGEHHAHEVDFLAVGQAGAVNASRWVFAWVRVGNAVGPGGNLAAGEDIVGGHTAQDVELFVAVGSTFDEHEVRPSGLALVT